MEVWHGVLVTKEKSDQLPGLLFPDQDKSVILEINLDLSNIKSFFKYRI